MLNFVEIWFVTRTNYRSFVYSADTVSCHYTYQALGGTITSPNYPESYGSNVYCRYDITVPDNVHVGLTVNSFDTEQDMDNLYVSLTPITMSNRREAYSTPQIPRYI